MRIVVGRAVERMRASLFVVPLGAVVLAVVLGQFGLEVDGRLDQGATDLPFALTSTVDSARAVLSTVAAATIGFAGIAFSVSLLVIQLGSSQYSPRVVHTLFRDPFNKRVMGVVVGTFTYCLIILRSVRSPLEESGRAVIPNLSVGVAVILGVGAILSIVAFINHNAHAMDISEILERVTAETVDRVRADWPTDRTVEGRRSEGADGVGAATYCVRFDRSGWVQQLDLDALVAAAPDGGQLVVHTAPGHYAIARTPACTLAPPPGDPEDTERRVLAAIGLGTTRTMQQDASYGLRQLVDVGLKGLSPGINDPTTAQDAILHIGVALSEMLHREAPESEIHGDHDRLVRLTKQPDHGAMVRLSFDELRRAAADHPAVSTYLLDTIALVRESVVARGLTHGVAELDDAARRISENRDRH